ncbi:MAG: diguanylate cyclase [Burkholderiales bacterium]|nr:diguanylate cyclase [Burkholderiales bacterium]
MFATQQDQLKSLFDLLPLGAYRLGMDGTILYANAALMRLNGFASEAEMLAAHGAFIPNPCLDPSRRALFYERLREEGRVRNFESEAVRYKTGEHMWIREHAQLVRDERGTPLYFEGTVEDITPERTTLKALQHSESMFQNILQAIPDRIWMKDLEGVYLTCNQAFASGLQATPELVCGTTDAHWLGIELATAILASDAVALKAGRAVRFEEYMAGPDGSRPMLYEIVKTPFLDHDGACAGVICIAHNIQQRKNSEAKLRDTTEQLELAIMGADLGQWDHDLTLEKGYRMDLRSCLMLGRGAEESGKRRAWGHLIHPDDLPGALRAMQEHLQGHTPAYEAEYRARHSDGRWIWLSSRGKIVQSRQDGSPQRMVGTLMDVSVRKQSEMQLRATQAELQATLGALPDLLVEYSATGVCRALHCHNLAGLLTPVENQIGKCVSDVLPQEAASICLAALEEAQTHGRSSGKQYSLELPGGMQWFELSVVRKPTDPGEEERFIAIARNITARKLAENAIEHLAFHDSLTGLPNRRLFNDRLQGALHTSFRMQQHAALLFIDLDKFKELNDQHGHEVGDLLLQEVGRRLQLCSRAIDTVARMGGDEFVLLVQDLSASDESARLHASTIAHKIIDSLNEPYVIRGLSHRVTPSIGVVVFLGKNIPPDILLKNADMAMYQAKGMGRNTVRFHSAPP